MPNGRGVLVGWTWRVFGLSAQCDVVVVEHIRKPTRQLRIVRRKVVRQCSAVV